MHRVNQRNYATVEDAAEGRNWYPERPIAHDTPKSEETSSECAICSIPSATSPATSVDDS